MGAQARGRQWERNGREFGTQWGEADSNIRAQLQHDEGAMGAQDQSSMRSQLERNGCSMGAQWELIGSAIGRAIGREFRA